MADEVLPRSPSRYLYLAALMALIVPDSSMPEPASVSMPIGSAAFTDLRGEVPRSLFISGHSLTDRPLPDHLESLAEADGHPLEWNMQHLAGSSLRMRAVGNFSAGTDKDGRAISMRGELSPTGGNVPYDTLIFTEVHTLLESLVWNDTVGNGSDLVTRFADKNSAAQAFLYTSWLGVDDMNDPSRWIAYERAAAEAWQCTASRINRDLAARGDIRQVRIIPAAEALAALVAEVMAGQGQVLADSTPSAAMRQIFADDVHLTELGSYYVALISYAVLYGAVPDRPWAPDVDPDKAQAVQQSARRFMVGWTQPVAMTMPECSAYLADHFAPIYLAYSRDTMWRDEGWLRAHYKWARFSIEWPNLLRSNSARNPFRYTSERP